MSILMLIGLVGAIAIGVTVLLAICFRVVVSTNDVHIVQSGRNSIVYGKGCEAGNVYYKWPSWVPIIGVKTISFPVSNFPVKLDGYEAYDKGRLPFQVDVMAFFRIENPILAAQRISEYKDLITQLVGILQGACRTILATSEIEAILEGRSEFGDRFTKEVDQNLANWGVQTVKNIEFMDIRDTKDSKVIQQIMAKKKSEIEMQSRVTVANNTQIAQLAEVAAVQIVEVRKQEAEQAIGQRKAEANQAVGISNEKAKQEIAVQAASTAEKNMAIQKVNDVRQAEISREVEIVEADMEAKKVVIKAEGDKKQTVTIAEGNLEQARLNAQGIELEGKAKGEAERAILQAPVDTQIALAREIGSNNGYQKYLVDIRVVEKDEKVGIAQAAALQEADIKVIANAGTASEGINSVGSLLSAKGGTSLGAMAEAFAQTPTGEALLKTLTGPSKKDGTKPNGNGAKPLS